MNPESDFERNMNTKTKKNANAVLHNYTVHASQPQLHLHSSEQSQHQVNNRGCGHVVVGQGLVGVHLLASVHHALLVRRDALGLLDLLHQTSHSGGRVDFHCDGGVGDQTHEHLNLAGIVIDLAEHLKRSIL